MASRESSQAAAARTPRAPGSGSFWEWIWRGNALRIAKGASSLSTVGRERLRRGRLAAELGDRAVDPPDPLRAGSSLPLSVSLYREAAYWLLVARSEGSESRSLRAAFDASQTAHAELALKEEELRAVRAALVEKTFVETAETPSGELAHEADLAQTFVHALLDHNEADREDQIATVLVQRVLRLGLVLVVALGLPYGARIGVQRALQTPDLAAGKPWRPSSRAYECHPKDQECGGAHTAIFFHTNEESRPWVEIDLGTPQPIGRIKVENREDCCAERAVPLIVEVGDDQKKWREVARRVESFQEWETAFAPVKARYVRLRVDRRSVLHLVRVGIHAK